MSSPKQLKSKDVPIVRLNILNEQDGLCPICSEEVKDPCLDHDHRRKRGGTGQIRGVLCRMCNSFVAKSENNCVRYNIQKDDLPDVLRNIANYLEKTHYPLIHPSEGPKRKVVTKASYNKMLRWHKENGTARRVAAYRYSAKDKPAQGLTKPLANMFEMAGVEPEFYK